jgi:hypothetical protein
MRMKKIVCIGILLIVLSSGMVLYSSYAIFPKLFVENYIDTRYSNTDYLNIEDKSRKQKQMISSTLTNNFFKFGRFEQDIKEFKDKQYQITLLNKQVNNVRITNSLIRINSAISIRIESNIDKDWYQRADYDLEFTLQKTGVFGYIINYIKVIHENVKSKSDQAGALIDESIHNHEH